MTKVIDIYSLPPAFNICDQELREVISIEEFSLAHVFMQPDASSLLHKHMCLKEIYYITRGSGMINVGTDNYFANQGDYFIIPNDTPHKLINFSEPLEHLVLAIPPFNPKDISQLNDESYYVNIAPKNPVIYSKKTAALDGVDIEELLSPKERIFTGVGLATGILAPMQKSNPHHHEISSEIYVVLEGRGVARVGDLFYEMDKNSAIHVPKQTIRCFENTSNDALKILCISAPAYSDLGFKLD
ncbi:MAG: cupin domain-containing protein [Candidatus Woesearchaeota archaeon]